MASEHNVHVTTEVAGEEKASGIAAILQAFFRNPVAAVEIVMFIGGAYGIYFTTNSSIADAKSTSEQHYRELTALSEQHYHEQTQMIQQNYERLTARLDILQANDKTQIDRIEAVYTRGDVRYQNMLAKLAAHDVDIARITTGIDYLVKAFEADGKSTNRQGMILPHLPPPILTPAVP